MVDKDWKVEQYQYLTFLLEDNMFGINILQVREIIEYGGVTQIPMMPDFIKGVINLRGSAVPVVDLSLRLGRKSCRVTKKTCIVIVEILGGEEQTDAGLLVDGVDEVLELAPDQVEPAPKFGSSIRTDFIHAMGKIGNKFIVLLDCNNILTLEELNILEGAKSQGSEIILSE